MKIYIILIMLIVILLILLAISILKYVTANKQKDFYKRLLEQSKDSVYYYEIKPKVRFKYISPSIKEILGISEEVFYKNHQSIFDLIHPGDAENLYKKSIGEVDYTKKQIARWQHKNGHYVWTEDYATPIYDKSGCLIGVEGSMRDITERKKLENELEFNSEHDRMTGLHNRDFFEKKFEELDKTLNAKIGIIVCDLDGLKFINDNFGHKKGDAMIIEAAKILNKISSDNISIARIGGDEFAAIIIDCYEEKVLEIVNRIKEDINTFNENDNDIKIKISIGYSVTENSFSNMNNLFSSADKKMYHEKRFRRSVISNNL